MHDERDIQGDDPAQLLEIRLRNIENRLSKIGDQLLAHRKRMLRVEASFRRALTSRDAGFDKVYERVKHIQDHIWPNVGKDIDRLIEIVGGKGEFYNALDQRKPRPEGGPEDGTANLEKPFNPFMPPKSPDSK